jgi:RNA polymerase sigma-70 factor, ECF subfamily
MATSSTRQHFESAYTELREIAAGYLRRERRDHTLQPTALVHEAFLRLAMQERGAWPSRQAFLAAAANVLRRVLVDHARKRRARRREHVRGKVPLWGADLITCSDPDRTIEVHDAICRLAEVDPRRARVVELRIFGGLTCAEVADVLGTARSTIADDWFAARAWLSRALAEDSREADN